MSGWHLPGQRAAAGGEPTADQRHGTGGSQLQRGPGLPHQSLPGPTAAGSPHGGRPAGAAHLPDQARSAAA